MCESMHEHQAHPTVACSVGEADVHMVCTGVTYKMPPMSSWWCVWQHAGEGNHAHTTGAVVTTAVAIAAVVMTAVEASCSSSGSVC